MIIENIAEKIKVSHHVVQLAIKQYQQMGSYKDLKQFKDHTQPNIYSNENY